MVLLVIVFGFLVVGSAFMTWKAVQLWRDPDLVDFFQGAFTCLPFGPDTRRGEVRSVGLTVVTMWGVVVLLALGTPDAAFSNPVVLVAFAVDVLIILGAGLAEVCVILFNAPKFAVPPHMRAEPGALAARRARKAESARRPGA